MAHVNSRRVALHGDAAVAAASGGGRSDGTAVRSHDGGRAA